MKTIHIHIGPHETGAEFIQKMVKMHSVALEKEHSLSPILDPLVQFAAQALNKGQEETAIAGLAQLATICRSRPGDVLISCGDLCGDLPGKSNKRRPYPKLFENINVIRKQFAEFQCKFYFFLRSPASWTPSVYAELSKRGSRFKSLGEFSSFLFTQNLWDETLRKARNKLNGNFVEIAYQEEKDFSPENALLVAVLGADKVPHIPQESTPSIQLSSETLVPLIKAVDQSSASSGAKRLAKEWLQSGADIDPMDADNMRLPKWPTQVVEPPWLSPELKSLWERTRGRVIHQDQPNFLPVPYCDLAESRTRLIEASDQFPSGGRTEMENQVRILKYRFRGLPETCFLLGLSISYLRRNTNHTAHAAFLFQRLWNEEYAILLGTLPTRWLISTFQTFLDHGANEAQRRIGSAAYFLSNILKAYEAERALDGLSSDGIYPNTKPTTQSGFPGMDRFNLGGTDLMLNTNALLLELAVQDDNVGRVVQEFMLRTKASDSIFSRMDQSRIEHGIDNPQFSNCWSFFEDPRK